MATGGIDVDLEHGDTLDTQKNDDNKSLKAELEKLKADYGLLVDKLKNISMRASESERPKPKTKTDARARSLSVRPKLTLPSAHDRHPQTSTPGNESRLGRRSV